MSNIPVVNVIKKLEWVFPTALKYVRKRDGERKIILLLLKILFS